MNHLEERATIHYRITPLKEPIPHVGSVLHACGLTNWHVVVLRIVRLFSPNEDGTIDVKMRVRRVDIGKECQPCPICDASWMTDASIGEEDA